MIRTNYVLVDYENVQPKSLTALVGDHPFKVLLFVGASQAKVTFEVAESMQALGANASYVKISGNGSNALDFHVAYYIGRISCEDPTAFFHIISKDAGFDPLIAHLKSKKILAARHKDVTDIPLLKAANSKTLAEKVDVVLANLRQRGASRPRTVKTLSSTIGSLFQKQLVEGDIKAILAELAKAGHAAMDGTKVSYTL
ncbi:PIN domain-containing protein [Luteibacter aegosomaticola]|uniref:PIN domain-containing protein n=1 Tax=Luteibacter aegosomaticola TaxID=2911538 RepID=UPI001FF71B2B|nr:PIN domain-containing protein [Luteibacter aegosomaticola]UPG90828.1 PIN domain-containing protein [Luteibacter aegosomaticola]